VNYGDGTDSIVKKRSKVVQVVIAGEAEQSTLSFIPAFIPVAQWIASLSPSSGARSRDPLARNDGFSTCVSFPQRGWRPGCRKYPLQDAQMCVISLKNRVAFGSRSGDNAACFQSATSRSGSPDGF
jgi:hypothetical protein